VSKEARYEKAAVAHRYNHLDRLYREMFRRATADTLQGGEGDYPGKDAARKFLKRCVDRGVEKSFIMKWMDNFQVYATRALGLGSLGVKYDITNQLLQASGAFDEAGKKEALRDWVAARTGYRNADKYVPRVNRDQITSNETSIALLEWNDVVEGSQVVAGSDQLQMIHIGVFAQGMSAIIQAVEQAQTQDPIKDYRTLAGGIQHVAQHLQFMAQDPRRKEEVKQVQQFLQTAQQSLGKLEQMAKRVVQQQAQMQQEQQSRVAQADQVMRDREIELKVFKAQREYELEKSRQDSLNDMRAEKTARQMDIQRDKQAETMRLKAEKQAADIQMAAARTQADIALKQARQ